MNLCSVFLVLVSLCLSAFGCVYFLMLFGGHYENRHYLYVGTAFFLLLIFMAKVFIRMLY